MQGSDRKIKVVFLALTALLLALFVIAIFRGDLEGLFPGNPQQELSGRLIVSFIDVGQGDAILVQAPGKNVLIDGGERGKGVTEYLEKRGVGALDLVIATHPHSDHIGGLINVLQSIPVKEVIDPGVVHTTKTFEDYLTLIDEKGIVFTEGRAGMVRELGDGVVLKFLHPSSPSTDLNESSIVTRITFGRISFMLTGDAGEMSEMEMLQRGGDLGSTILKVGHHGSTTATSPPFLQAVKPTAAVIMCGRGNVYGFPHEETLAKLAEAKVEVYRTDLQGTIVISTDGKTFEIDCEDYSVDRRTVQPRNHAVHAGPMGGKG